MLNGSKMKATLLILCVYITHIQTFPPRLNRGDKHFAETILKLVIERIQDTTRRISLLHNMQKQNSDCAPFEIGYVTYIIQDKYKRMVDLYNASVFMNRKLYLMEHVLHLQDIEHIYWEINHLSSMLHEIERKYGQQTQRLDVVYDDEVSFTTKTTGASYHIRSTFSRQRSTLFSVNKYLQEGKWSTTRKRKKKWWPLEYGAYNSLQILRPLDKIINELSWGTKIKIFKDLPSKIQRRVGISYLRTPEDTTIDTKSTKSLAVTVKSEDSSMKIKLFRLMYETVRDSDLKAKRAELIKTHYTNYSTFEIGFIMGDITDKFNIMTDIALTLKRLYQEWKPMEHINAYEQIANKAIEISHLIDIIRIINKRNPYNTISPSSPHRYL